jgi:eIF-2B alpha/beta/delta-like uncharacterized protein
MIGEHGLKLIENISKQKNGLPVNILTHCNAGWLAFVDHGTATSPIYAAHGKGMDVHVWVDETRPRNQGASLTAWELGMHGIPHTIITDNTGGHLMQHGMVDMVIVGSDRTTSTGDVANKIGTYLKALAAKDNNIPFYAAVPMSSFDWHIENGISQIEIEERDPEEVAFIEGLCEGEIKKVQLTPAGSPAKNFGFDVTPARLVTGIITERGICEANKKSINEYTEKNIEKWMTVFRAEDEKHLNPEVKQYDEEKSTYDLIVQGKMGNMKFRPYQRKFIEDWSIATNELVILYYGVGSGKTLIAINCAEQFINLNPNSYIYMLLPASLVINTIMKMYEVNLDPRRKNDKGEYVYKFISYQQMMLSQVDIEPNSLLIIDEAHNLRNFSTKEIFEKKSARKPTSASIVYDRDTYSTYFSHDQFY